MVATIFNFAVITLLNMQEGVLFCFPNQKAAVAAADSAPCKD